MKPQSTPFMPETVAVNRFLWLLVTVAIRLSPLIGPRPAALLIRRVFAAHGKALGRSIDRKVPGIEGLLNERYDREPEAKLDVYWPAGATEPLPLLLWIHGGGWVGGSKDELAGYFKILAQEGFVVVGADYSRSPEFRYPTPLRQLMRALQYLQDSPQRYHLDPQRMVLAGDSAGAQIAAQLAAMVTTPGYAKKIGVEPTIKPQQLCGVVLACGAYDRTLAWPVASPADRRFIRTVTWAYTGKRNFLTRSGSKEWSVTDNLTRDFPPALITAGNADPLRAHSELLATRLDALGVKAETVFFPPRHRPRLGHEYQFGLDLAEARQFLARQRDFLRRVSAESP